MALYYENDGSTDVAATVTGRKAALFELRDEQAARRLAQDALHLTGAGTA